MCFWVVQCGIKGDFSLYLPLFSKFPMMRLYCGFLFVSLSFGLSFLVN